MLVLQGKEKACLCSHCANICFPVNKGNIQSNKDEIGHPLVLRATRSHGRNDRRTLMTLTLTILKCIQ